VTLQVGSMEMRDMMLEAEPKLFYITDHYRKFPFVLVRLSALTRTVLKDMLVGPRRAIGGHAAHQAPPEKARQEENRRKTRKEG